MIITFNIANTVKVLLEVFVVIVIIITLHWLLYKDTDATLQCYNSVYSLLALLCETCHLRLITFMETCYGHPM